MTLYTWKVYYEKCLWRMKRRDRDMQGEALDCEAGLTPASGEREGRLTLTLLQISKKPSQAHKESASKNAQWEFTLGRNVLALLPHCCFWLVFGNTLGGRMEIYGPWSRFLWREMWALESKAASVHPLGCTGHLLHMIRKQLLSVSHGPYSLKGR